MNMEDDEFVVPNMNVFQNQNDNANGEDAQIDSNQGSMFEDLGKEDLNEIA